MKKVFNLAICSVVLSVLCACNNSLMNLDGNSELTSIGDTHKTVPITWKQNGYLGISNDHMFDIPFYNGLSEIADVANDYAYRYNSENGDVLYLVNTDSYRSYKSTYLTSDTSKIGEYSPSEVSELLFLDIPSFLYNSGILSESIDKERIEETFEQKVMSVKDISINGYSGIRETGSFRFSSSTEENIEYIYAGYFLNDKRKSPESWVVLTEEGSGYSTQDLLAIVDYTAENVKVN